MVPLVVILFIPIWLAYYWWITVPAYYGIIFLEFRSIRILKLRGAMCKGLTRLAKLQVWLPFLAIILYPIMPGSTSTGEPLGLNEKAFYSCSVTFLLVIGCIVTFALKKRNIRKKLKTEQGVAGYPPQGVGSPER